MTFFLFDNTSHRRVLENSYVHLRKFINNLMNSWSNEMEGNGHEFQRDRRIKYFGK